MKERPILKYCLLVAMVMALACAIFWREVVEKSRDVTGRLIGEPLTSEKSLSGDLTSISGFRLDLERNDIRKIFVRDMQVDSKNGRDAEVSFLVTNTGGVNDFPSLRVHLLDAQRKALRQIEFSPDEYMHSAIFRAERIQINVVLQSGESSFTVEPFYKLVSRP